MHEALYHAVFIRLLEADDLSTAAVDLVDAACRGATAFQAALTASGAGAARPAPTAPPTTAPLPPSAYLSRIEATGFRGIGPTAGLDLHPGPGLTVILGRNGSGKSSFAEGLEILLTGACRRWSDRPKDWQDGWRCLHGSGPTRIAATFAVEGHPRPVVLTRTWADGAGLEAGAPGGETSVSALGWGSALTTFRPLLSSRDLDAALERGTSKLFDEMKAILGLGEITEAIGRLADRRKSLARARKGSADSLKALLPRLAMEDPRARACLAALQGRTRDLDAVEEIVLGGGDDDEGRGLLDNLRTLANLAVLDLDLLGRLASTLRAAVEREAAVAGTDAARAGRLAGLLEAAVAVQREVASDDCPVCKQPLPEAWLAAATVEIVEHNAAAREAREARDALTAALRAATSAIKARPPVLAAADVMGLGAEAAEAWAAWSDAPTDAVALAAHLEDRGVILAAAVRAVRDEASAKLVELQDVWKPVATQLAAWLEGARAVAAAETTRVAVTAAETWLKEIEEDLRDARFQPIATRARDIWSKLRQQSSVDLTQIRLAGTATRRKLELDVSVDGTEGVALGVMSQGELNALALSLFLPRMLLDESPFRFVLVDDPIQSMDPNKVDGLAEVLGDAARTRQVIVLTHDPRLVEALRRLRIDTTVLRVARRGESTVEVTPSHDPVLRHLSDARRLVKEEDKLGRSLAERVVPGLCRMAVEAACHEAVRRRRLGRGDRHEAVEEALGDAHTTHAMVTLALFDEAARQGDTYTKLKNQYGDWAYDWFQTLNAGTHSGWTRELDLLVRRTQTVVQGLRA